MRMFRLATGLAISFLTWKVEVVKLRWKTIVGFFRNSFLLASNNILYCHYLTMQFLAYVLGAFKVWRFLLNFNVFIFTFVLFWKISLEKLLYFFLCLYLLCYQLRFLFSFCHAFNRILTRISTHITVDIQAWITIIL